MFTAVDMSIIWWVPAPGVLRIVSEGESPVWLMVPLDYLTCGT